MALRFGAKGMHSYGVDCNCSAFVRITEKKKICTHLTEITQSLEVHPKEIKARLYLSTLNEQTLKKILWADRKMMLYNLNVLPDSVK